MHSIHGEMSSINPEKKEGICACFGHQYEELRSLPDNLGYWFPKIEGKGFKTPDTIVFELSSEQFSWARCDQYLPEEMEEFKNLFLAAFEETGFLFDRNKGMFLKTGNFSNKFDFSKCHVHSPEDVAVNYIQWVLYNSMVVGAPPSPQLVLRSFIDGNPNRPSIYNGMKLNTEFRAFIDFDSNEILGVFNYWDSDTVRPSLHDPSDASVFESVSKELEEEFKLLRPVLEDQIKAKLLSGIDFRGKWSVDFLHDGNEFWLIDMAPAEKSYYFDRL